MLWCGSQLASHDMARRHIAMRPAVLAGAGCSTIGQLRQRYVPCSTAHRWLVELHVDGGARLLVGHCTDDRIRGAACRWKGIEEE